MNTSGPALRVVLYSEDRADADRDFSVLREVLLGMLQQVTPDVKTQHIKVEPVQPVRRDRVCGSFWKARTRAEPGAQELRRRLVRDVATALRLGAVVFFHVDADEVWARRGACATLQEHWPRFARDVQTVLRNVGADVSDVELQHVLIAAVPFWEIESWAFANTARLRQILADPRDLATLAVWEHDLGVLDETADIKDALSIGDGRSADLVQRRHGFPAAALVALDKSYAAVVGRLRASPAVARGLAEASARPY